MREKKYLNSVSGLYPSALRAGSVRGRKLETIRRRNPRRESPCFPRPPGRLRQTPWRCGDPRADRSPLRAIFRRDDLALSIRPAALPRTRPFGADSPRARRFGHSLSLAAPPHREFQFPLPYTEEGIEIRDAAELRVKESDRIAALAENLHRMGASVEERPDGLKVQGRRAGKLRGAEIDPRGDHRIAMAFAVAGLAAEGSTVIRDADCAGVSFPTFFPELNRLAER